ncbi:MAG TPA: metallophosphoesterase [Nitrososphaeraceae archaeon]|nr:metallophosphoesterase [Nitrososphaeraceae archaeon]
MDPELVLALGDLSYNGKSNCWLELIEPIADKTKIVIGNHESASSKLRKDYMNYFSLKEQYYSFNYKNTHFLALSTEIPFDVESKQYEFAKQDLEKYSKDPLLIGLLYFIIGRYMDLLLEVNMKMISEKHTILFLKNTK